MKQDPVELDPNFQDMRLRGLRLDPNHDRMIAQAFDHLIRAHADNRRSYVVMGYTAPPQCSSAWTRGMQ